MRFAIEYQGHRCPPDSAIKPWGSGCGPVPGERREIGDEQFILGRGTEADLRTVSNGIARHHLRLVRQGDRLEAVDLGGTNGTEVDGVPLKEPAHLVGGERLTIALFFDFRVVCLRP